MKKHTTRFEQGDIFTETTTYTHYYAARYRNADDSFSEALFGTDTPLANDGETRELLANLIRESTDAGCQWIGSLYRVQEDSARQGKSKSKSKSTESVCLQWQKII